ncbi:MAG: STAS domain-containing protein [Prevotella sp.]|nr:STAS domain-containing protein [Prevotella sp.]
MLKVTINEQEGRLIVALSGDFDNVASMRAERDLEPVFERTDCDVVVDCTQLDYISSSGLRIMLRIYKHTRSNGRKAVLKGLKDDLKEVFELSGFMPLFVLEK